MSNSYNPLTGKRTVNSPSSIELSDHLPFLLGQVYQLRRRQLEGLLKEQILLESEYRVLVALSDRDGCGVSELSEWAVLERTTLSRMLLSMEEKGLVHRQQSSLDRRIIKIFMAPEGMRAFRKIMPFAQKHLDQMIEGLSEQDIEALKTSLRLLIENLVQSNQT